MSISVISGPVTDTFKMAAKERGQMGYGRKQDTWEHTGSVALMSPGPILGKARVILAFCRVFGRDC